MVRKVSMHDIKSDDTISTQCLNLADRIDRREEKIIERKKFQFLFNYFFETIQFLRYNNISNCSLETEQTYLRKASKYISIYAANVGEESKSVSVSIDNNEIDLQTSKFEDADFTMILSFYLTILNGRTEDLQLLQRFDLEKIYFPDKVGFQYEKRFIQLLRELIFERKFEDVISNQLSKISKSAEEVLAEFKPDYSYKIYLLEPLVDAMKAINDKDNSTFNDSLYEALVRHKEFWSSDQIIEPGSPSLKRQSEGWLSYPVLALMKLGAKKDLTIEVESDYSPKRLLFT